VTVFLYSVLKYVRLLFSSFMTAYFMQMNAYCSDSDSYKPECEMVLLYFQYVFFGHYMRPLDHPLDRLL